MKIKIDETIKALMETIVDHGETIYIVGGYIRDQLLGKISMDIDMATSGKAEDIALGFDKNGLGGIVNASRSLMCAYKSDLWKNKFEEKDYAKATRAEALKMKEELNKYINT